MELGATDGQEATPRKKAENKKKQHKRKVRSKKERVSPAPKKTKESCCSCKSGKCISTSGYKPCVCRSKGKACDNCASPNCCNAALDTKFTEAEKQQSFTPEGPTSTPKQQARTAKQSKSPPKAVIQSWERAVDQLIKKLDALNAEIGSFREGQKNDRLAMEKLRQENADLKEEIKKGKLEFQKFRSAWETKALQQEVKAAIGEKNTGIQFDRGIVSNNQGGNMSNTNNNGSFRRRNSESRNTFSQGTSNPFAPLAEHNFGHRDTSRESTTSNWQREQAASSENYGSSRRNSVSHNNGNQGASTDARSGAGSGSGFGSSHSSRPRTHLKVPRRLSTQSESHVEAAHLGRNSATGVAGRGDIQDRRKRTVVVYGYTTQAGVIDWRRIQRDILGRVEVAAQIKHVTTKRSNNNYNNYNNNNNNNNNNSNVVVLVELDSEKHVNIVLSRSARLKGSGLYVRADRSPEERQRDWEQKRSGQVIPPGSRRNVVDRPQYTQEDIQQAVRVVQSLNASGNGHWNSSAPQRSAAGSARVRQYGGLRH